jgi:hypothetical protein
MSDLLPCPFCGGAGRVSWSRDREIVNIRCELWPHECLGAGPNCLEEPAAIAAWNRRAPGWHPISTAPRDGTRFWGNVDDDAIAMCWHEGFAAFVSSWRRMELALGYTCADTGLSYRDHSPVKHNPTHWQPRPPAPEPTP